VSLISDEVDEEEDKRVERAAARLSRSMFNRKNGDLPEDESEEESLPAQSVVKSRRDSFLGDGEVVISHH